ncbi:MAG: IS110 family transposase [Planctomycetes bacterium]|nr:IS110 family transposase [Planctomycetota bacterium]
MSRSVKKTDKNDAETLALFLSKGLLPEIRMKDKLHSHISSLSQTRDKLVKLRTTLKKNKQYCIELWHTTQEGSHVE